MKITNPTFKGEPMSTMATSTTGKHGLDHGAVDDARYAKELNEAYAEGYEKGRCVVQEQYSMLDDTLTERRDRLNKARREERERCVVVARTYGGDEGSDIADLINALGDEK